jgi:hypothetical protein
MTESGFRDRGWEIAQLEETYPDHVSGWDYYVPSIAEVALRRLRRIKKIAEAIEHSHQARKEGTDHG